jgi:hypothetical protein
MKASSTPGALAGSGSKRDIHPFGIVSPAATREEADAVESRSDEREHR